MPGAGIRPKKNADSELVLRLRSACAGFGSQRINALGLRARHHRNLSTVNISRPYLRTVSGSPISLLGLSCWSQM